MDSDVAEGTSSQREIGSPWRRWWFVLIATALVVAADQGSKEWALSALEPAGLISRPFILGIEFRLSFNQGMAFSAGASLGPVIGVVAVGIVLVMLWFARTLQRRHELVLVGMVIGGALGNVIDRFARAGSGVLSGKVVDFVYTGWWPTFNVADAAIVVGGLSLAVATAWPARRQLSSNPVDNPTGSTEYPAALADDLDDAHLPRREEAP